MARADVLPPELDADALFVGRESELDWLREHWRRVRGGAGRLVLLTGETGVERTRLAAELAREVYRAGGAVLFAACDGPQHAAREALSNARKPVRPTLVVLDDVDRASRELHSAVSELVDELAALPALVVATAQDPALAPVTTNATLALARLDGKAEHTPAELPATARGDERAVAARAALDELACGLALKLFQACDAEMSLICAGARVKLSVGWCGCWVRVSLNTWL
jgi:hypothetical protein